MSELIAIFIVVCVIGIFIYAGIQLIKQEKKCSVKVNAVIEDIERKVSHSGGERRISYVGHCSFYYNGMHYTTDEMQLTFSPVKTEGSTIEIYINPNNPSEAMIKNYISKKISRAFIWLPIIVVLNIGFVFSAQIFLSETFLSNFFKLDNYIQKASENSGDSTDYERTLAGASSTTAPTATHEPINLISGKYCGVVIGIPDYYSKVIYAGNDEQSGNCYFYSKKTSKVIFEMKVASNKTTVKEAVVGLRNYVRKKGSEPTFCKKVVSNGAGFEVYSVTVGETSDGKPDYDYYAISATAKKRIILINYDNEDELVSIVNTVKY